MVGLTILLVASCEIASLIRRRIIAFRGSSKPMTASDVTSSAVFGLLAILLGFALFLVISRYETKKRIAIREANAIETAYSQARLLDSAMGQQLRHLMKLYVDDRLSDFQWTAETSDLQGQIWRLMDRVQPVEEQESIRPLVGSLNKVFVTRSETVRVYNSHIPEAVYYLIIGVAVFGVVFNDRGRLWALMIAMAVSILIAVIQDLDRPLGGFFQVNEARLDELKDSLFH